MDLHEVEDKVKVIVEKAKSDPDFHEQLKSDPVKAIEGLIGKDLPDEQVKAIVSAVKEKLALDSGIKGLEEKIAGFFHKK